MPHRPPPSSLDSLLSRRARRETDTEVSEFMKRALDNPALISLAAGFVDQESLPCERVARLAGRLLADPHKGREALQYGTTLGDPGLRQAIARRFGRNAEGLAIDPENVIVTAGSQEFLYLLTEILIDPGDIALVEAPTYFVYAATLQGAGAQTVGLAVDNWGLLPEALEDALAKFDEAGQGDRVKLLYLMTYYANPRGTSYSWERRRAIFDIARRRAEAGRPFVIVEDIAYRELRYEGPDMPPLKSLDAEGALVAACGSFSKAFSPGLRTGYAIAPKPLAAALGRLKSNLDFGSPMFAQSLIREALESGEYDEHVADLRRRYRHKRDLALRAIEQNWPRQVRVLPPEGGLYLWAQLPRHVSADPGEELFERALRNDVLYIPGSLCYVPTPGRPRPCHEMRLCFGMIDDERLAEGLRRLGAALRELLDA